MGQKKQPPKIKPPSKEIGTSIDPTIHYKLKVIAAQQSIPLNELTRRVLSYYANSYMPSTPAPPLPYTVEQMPYVGVASNGNGFSHL
jgi:hypothetical protein